MLWSGSDVAVTTRLIAQPAEIDLERRCLCSREWLEAVRGKHIVKIKPCDSFCFPSHSVHFGQGRLAPSAEATSNDLNT